MGLPKFKDKKPKDGKEDYINISVISSQVYKSSKWALYQFFSPIKGTIETSKLVRELLK